MLNAIRSSKSNVFGWILILLLIVALAGFGFSDLVTGGRSNTVASVGDQTVTVNEFAQAFQNRQQQLSQQVGSRLSTQDLVASGVDQSVLQQLTRTATVDSEASELGLSVSDEVVRRSLAQTDAFRGVDGTFSADMYEFALRNANLRAGEYEDTVRRDTARAMLAEIVSAGITVPDAATRAIITYIGEERGFDWVLVPSADQDAPSSADDGALQTYLDENPAQFRRPETRVVSYVVLDPAVLAQSITFSDEELMAEYEIRQADFQQPERRIVDQIGFGTMEDAATAAAALGAGETSVAEIAAERGIDGGDFSLGTITRSSLSGAAAEAVFGADGTGFVGPVETDLGPAVFAINAILAAQEQSFEQARETIALDLAILEAEEQVITESVMADELIAGGATPEEIAAETAFTFGTVTLTAQGGTGVAADPAFRAEAFASDLEEDRDLVETEGRIFYRVRVDEIREATVPPLADIRAEVLTAWTAAQRADAARAQAEALVSRITGGEALADIATELSQTVRSVEPTGREGQAADLPIATMGIVFNLEEGGTGTVDTDEGTAILQLTTIDSYDFTAEDSDALIDFYSARYGAGVQEDILTYFVNARAEERGVAVNPQIVQQILAQLP
ncbi:MAG: SurA N-terminal domain-containing protein [Pseudomonadota bacterium]